MATTEEIRERIQSIRSTRPDIGTLESIQQAIVASDTAAATKQGLLKEIREIAFFNSIDFATPVVQASANEGASDRELTSVSAPSDHPSLEGEAVEQPPMASARAASSDTTHRAEASQHLDHSLDEQLDQALSADARLWLHNYKRFYLFEASAREGSERLLLIHDNIPSPQLVGRTFKDFDLVTVADFVAQIRDKSTSLWNARNICLLVLSDSTERIKDLIAAQDSLQEFHRFHFHEIIITTDKIRTVQHQGEKLFSEIETDSHITLTNSDLDRAEESLIRGFFASTPSLVTYKLLKGGFSGSKIIEVSQVFSVSKPCRFVIKIGPLKDKKISTEERAVKQWVSNLANEYQTEIRKNATHEALKYTFASRDGKRDSTSFTSIFLREKNSNIPRQLVKQVFDHDLMRVWEETQAVAGATTVQSAYAHYIKADAVRGHAREVLFEKVDETCDKFDKVLGLPLERFVTKACHGDLHSENIMYDGERVFLIDFGMTDTRHCFIDFTTLEASIRLRLTPFYIPTGRLRDADSEFLTEFDITDSAIEQKIQNVDLRKSYEVIAAIRREALDRVCKNSHTFSGLEEAKRHYLISLFAIAYRNLGFRDLNQKYAVCLCRALADHLLA